MEDKRKKGLFYNLFNYGAEYDEFEDDFDCDYKDSKNIRRQNWWLWKAIEYL